ncbi:MAG: RNA polymerase sigma factor [Thermoanaerobaculia bacterium]|jgi:RNA polymerase sigma-70 factor (ECF subfamily)
MAPHADILALAVHRREDGAFELLVGQFEQQLFNYVYRLIQNVHDAQEVVQDTFLRAHKALTRQYDEPKCAALLVRPWLYRIARNLAMNKRRGLRAKIEQPLPPEEHVGFKPAVRPPTLLCSIETREELERLDRALATLPVEARELVFLRFIEEMSYADIAKTTGLGEAVLRGKVFRSLRQLRDTLASTEERSHAM